MKQLFISLLLSLLLPCSAIAQKKQTDREHDGLIGQVRAINIEEGYFSRKTGNWTESRIHTLNIIYNPEGQMMEQHFYNDKCVWAKKVYSYDVIGNRSETIYWGEAIDRQPAQASGANDARNLAAPRIFNHVFKYGADGNRSEVSEYNSDGALRRRTVFAYDNKGRINEIIEYGDKLIRSKCLNNYDEKGQVKEKLCYDSTGTLHTKTSYTYEFDSIGNWIKRVASSWNVTDGKQSEESRRATYRTITYNTAHNNAGSGVSDGASTVPLNPASCQRVIRKSGGLLQNSAVKRVEPKYPSSALPARIGGKVVVEILVDEEGNVVSAKALSGPTDLQRASVEAAKDWKFVPTTLIDVPVRVIGTITFQFSP